MDTGSVFQSDGDKIDINTIYLQHWTSNPIKMTGFTVESFKKWLKELQYL